MKNKREFWFHGRDFKIFNLGKITVVKDTVSGCVGRAKLSDADLFDTKRGLRIAALHALVHAEMNHGKRCFSAHIDSAKKVSELKKELVAQCSKVKSV